MDFRVGDIVECERKIGKIVGFYDNLKYVQVEFLPTKIRTKGLGHQGSRKDFTNEDKTKIKVEEDPNRNRWNAPIEDLKKIESAPVEFDSTIDPVSSELIKKGVSRI